MFKQGQRVCRFIKSRDLMQCRGVIPYVLLIGIIISVDGDKVYVEWTPNEIEAGTNKPPATIYNMNNAPLYKDLFEAAKHMFD